MPTARPAAPLIAIEGIDGSGKGTQTQLLAKALRERGLSVAVWSFPRYQATRFGQLIGRFLNGEFGSLQQVSPWLAALLFAGDRKESREELLTSLATHDIVLCDRFVASNIGHQASKLQADERAKLVDWLLWLEHDLFELPRPALVLYLDLPVELAQQWIIHKAARSYTTQTADLQEADSAYLTASQELYRTLASTEPGWKTISCVHNGAARPPAEICAELLQQVMKVVPQPAQPDRNDPSTTGVDAGYLELARSRRAWIDDQLRPWCQTATLTQLLRAEGEWGDLAGRAPAEQTLWRWAWSRFPELVHPDLGIDETYPVRVVCANGRVIEGYPDARASVNGQLVLLSVVSGQPGVLSQPVSIDAMTSVMRLREFNTLNDFK